MAPYLRKIKKLGNGYRIRATRKSVGMFEVVAIDWEHPNYGYFADAMLWHWSMHHYQWTPIHVARWTLNYKTVDEFLEEYPTFEKLFQEPQQFDVLCQVIRENRTSIREQFKKLK